MGVVQPNVQPQQKCYVLGYNQGYANLSSVHYLAVKNTANKGACCNLCLRDNRCVAWTRVAGECQTFSPLYELLHAGSQTLLAWCKVASAICTSCQRSRINHLCTVTQSVAPQLASPLHAQSGTECACAEVC